jgi:allantoin racemase
MKLKFILPVPMKEEVLRIWESQIPKNLLREGDEIRFAAVRNSGTILDSYYDDTLADLFVLAEAVGAEKEGYDAVVVYTMSDSGLQAIRSRLDIPAIGAGVASLHFACMLGDKFSVITSFDRWIHLYRKLLNEYRLYDRCASLRHIGSDPNAELQPATQETFKKLENECLNAINEDGASVIVLGSTTMNQFHKYLTENLPVPVVNPGLVCLKIAQAMVDLKLSQSKRTYPSPSKARDEMISAIAEASGDYPWP